MQKKTIHFGVITKKQILENIALYIIIVILSANNLFAQNIRYLPKIHFNNYEKIFRENLKFEFDNSKITNTNWGTFHEPLIESNGLLILKPDTKYYYSHDEIIREVFLRGIIFFNQGNSDFALKEFSSLKGHFFPQDYRDSTLLVYCNMWLYKITKSEKVLKEIEKVYKNKLRDKYSYMDREIASFFFHENLYDLGYKYFITTKPKLTYMGDKFTEKIDYTQKLTFELSPFNPVYYFTGIENINPLIIECELLLKKNKTIDISNRIFSEYSKNENFNSSFDINLFELNKAKIFCALKDYNSAQNSLDKFLKLFISEYYSKTIFLNGYTSEFEMFRFNQLKNIYINLILENTQFLGSSNRIFDIENTTKDKDLNLFTDLKKIVNSSNNIQLIKDFQSFSDLNNQLIFQPSSEEISLLISQKWKILLMKYKILRDYIEKNINTSYGNLTSQLNPHECILQFFIYENMLKEKCIGLNIIGGDSNSIKTINICKLEELNRIFTSSKSNVDIYNRGMQKSNYSSNPNLYSLIWKPIVDEIPKEKTIYLSTVDILNNISFNAILISDNKYLIDEYDIHNINNIKRIKDENTQNFTSIFLFGGINYNLNDKKTSIDSIKIQIKGNFEEWRFLEGSKKEISNIENITQKHNIESQVFTGSNASEEKIKSLNAKGIIHLATHGYYFNKKTNLLNNAPSYIEEFNDPLIRTGIVFSGVNQAWTNKSISPFMEDGILTSYETTKLDLKNVSLIVLSACSSGLGDISENEGTYGLQRGFKIAGAKNIICSLWEIPDFETVELMTIFYETLFTTNDIYKSLKKAQMHLRKNPKYTPYHWGAFILLN